MYRSGALRLIFLLAVVLFSTASRCTSPQGGVGDTSGLGIKAFNYTEAMLSYGPRPPGSESLEAVRKWIQNRVEEDGFEYREQPFEAGTPIGSVAMKNLSFRITGSRSAKYVVLGAHYETKKFDSITFLGANDATSSVALILTLAPLIRSLELPFDVEVVFFDGEEALVQWSQSDSLYGSRYYVEQLDPGNLPEAALIVDMVGDRNLKYVRNRLMSSRFLALLETILQEMGRTDLLEANFSSVVDDQVPFLDRGIGAFHLMDFSYGGESSPGTYWHTEEDTLDKLSAESLQVSGEVLLRFLLKLAEIDFSR